MALRLRVGRPSVLTTESLERRRMLSVAPVGVDDAYDLGPDHRLSVDVTAPAGLPAFDLSEQPASPAPGPFTIPEFMLTLEHGERRTEPDWFAIAEAPNTYAEVTIRDPGSLWRVNNWLEMGDRGRATVLISDGGTLSVGNFLELAEQGAGTITVRNGGHLRTENWTGVAAAESSTRLDGGVGAVLLTGAGSNWTSVNHVSLGANGGTAALDIEDGATMLVEDSLTAGHGPRSRGTVTCPAAAD